MGVSEETFSNRLGREVDIWNVVRTKLMKITN